MSARQNAPLGSPCWVDLMTSDADLSRAFYGDLFGWECEDPDPDLGGYANFTCDGERVAGLMTKMVEELPDVWSVYLEVADAAATVSRVEALGLPVVVPAMPVADLGVMAVVTDPTDAVVGLWQPGSHPGFRRWMEPRRPGWFELLTRDLDKAVAFYREVFGWETRLEADDAELRYVTQVEGELQFAGIMDVSGTAMLPPEVPAHWSLYVDVADIDASCARATDLGATVVMEPEDTPYGRLAVLSDPTGAAIKLHQ